jgi:hypothetical protein
MVLRAVIVGSANAFEKLAVIELVELSVTVQVADAPLHVGVHALNVPPDPGRAVTTTLLVGNVAEQIAGQLIPAWLLVTTPLLEPLIVTVKENV